MYLVPMLDEDNKIIRDKNGQVIMIEVSKAVYDYFKEELKSHRRHQTETDGKLLYFDTEIWNNAAFLAKESTSAEDGALGWKEDTAQIEDADYRKRLAEYKQHLPGLQAACTEKQWRRFILYHVHRKNLKEIALLEGCSFVAVSYSIRAAKEKIKKVLGKKG